jgi:hypothetical protein
MISKRKVATVVAIPLVFLAGSVWAFDKYVTPIIPRSNVYEIKRDTSPRPLERMCTTKKVSGKNVNLYFNEQVNCLKGKARTAAKYCGKPWKVVQEGIERSEEYGKLDLAVSFKLEFEEEIKNTIFAKKEYCEKNKGKVKVVEVEKPMSFAEKARKRNKFRKLWRR